MHFAGWLKSIGVAVGLASVMFGGACTESQETGVTGVTLPLTVAAWVRPNSVDMPATVVGVGSNYRLELDGNEASWPTTNRAVSSATVSANQWTHLVGVSSATNEHRVYVNGGAKGTSSGSTSLGSVSTLYVGTNADQVMGYVAIWSAALTDDEAATLASGANPLQVRAGDLIRFYPMTSATADKCLVSGKTLSMDDTTLSDRFPPHLLGGNHR